MQVFKHKAIRRVASALVLTAMIICTYIVVTDNLSDTTYRTYFEKDIEEIKEAGEDVDIVFIGASRLYLSMMPEVFEEKLGLENVLVAATATQPICGTYYYIKELLEDVHPKKIIIDVTWDRLLNERAAQPCLLVYDRLSFKNKLEFVYSCFEKKDYKYILGPVRYKNNIMSMKSLMKEKQEIKARGYDMYDPENDYYVDKGFVYSYQFFETGNIPIYGDGDFTYSDEAIIEENKNYLDKCIELCHNSGVEVELVTAPCSLPYIYYVNNYDAAVQWYKKYANEKGVVYHNLSYIKNREEILPDECMMDIFHTNGKGAEKISSIYADILRDEKNGIDCEDRFYDNLEELSLDVHRIVSVRGKISWGGFVDSKQDTYLATIKLDSLARNKDEVFYQVEMRLPGEDFVVISEWSKEEERELQLPSNSNIEIKVRAKNQHEGDKEAFQIYSY